MEEKNNELIENIPKLRFTRGLLNMLIDKLIEDKFNPKTYKSSIQQRIVQIKWEISSLIYEFCKKISDIYNPEKIILNRKYWTLNIIFNACKIEITEIGQYTNTGYIIECNDNFTNHLCDIINIIREYHKIIKQNNLNYADILITIVQFIVSRELNYTNEIIGNINLSRIIVDYLH